MFRICLAVLVCFLHTAAVRAAEPKVVGHRGLMPHAPEETQSAFAACIDLRVSVELDVRRTRDGHLICLHDATLNRTTTGTGKVSELSLREIRQFDAGKKFDALFTGERVLTLEEVFTLYHDRKATSVLIAVDLKEPECEVDVVRLAEKYDVLKQLVFIGLAIEKPAVRERLLGANTSAACAALCPSSEKLADAITDKSSSWVYVRFIPTEAEVKKVHAAGKKVFLVGMLVAGRKPENWAKGRAVGVDAILTDYPLECRASWRPKK